MKGGSTALKQLVYSSYQRLETQHENDQKAHITKPKSGPNGSRSSPEQVPHPVLDVLGLEWCRGCRWGTKRLKQLDERFEALCGAGTSHHDGSVVVRGLQGFLVLLRPDETQHGLVQELVLLLQTHRQNLLRVWGRTAHIRHGGHFCLNSVWSEVSWFTNWILVFGTKYHGVTWLLHRERDVIFLPSAD